MFRSFFFRRATLALRPRAFPRFSLSFFSSPQVSYLLADSLIPKCTSCGITLQNKEPKTPGYYIDPSHKTKAYTKAEDVAYSKAYANLSEEDKRLLTNGEPVQKTEKKKALQNGHSCMRCRNATFQSSFDSAQHQADSVETVMSLLPPVAHVVYVVSAADFPMSLDSEVFRFRAAKNIRFAITKSDLFFERNAIASKNGLQFFQHYLSRYNVPADHVHLVSGKADWNTDRLYSAIASNTFFIGAVNSGKLTLLQLLLYVAQKEREKLPNAKRERKREKEQLSGVARRKQRALEVQRLKSTLGPGVSHMPGFTRGIIPVQLTNKVVVYDVPGFDTNNESSQKVLDVMLPSAMKHLIKGKSFPKHGTYKSRYDTAKSGQVITVGGTFFMQVPPDCMYRVRNVINHKLHIFSSMDKALEVWKSAKDQKAVDGLFLVDPRAKLVKYKVPSFHGSFDLVLRSFGYVNITATGAAPENPEPLYVYLPEGIGAVWREPVAQYMTKSLSGRDKNGNVLKKENWVKLSTKVLKTLPKESVFFQPLEPTNM